MTTHTNSTRLMTAIDLLGFEKGVEAEGLPDVHECHGYSTAQDGAYSCWRLLGCISQSWAKET
jgi:hypothetical protein